MPARSRARGGKAKKLAPCSDCKQTVCGSLCTDHSPRCRLYRRAWAKYQEPKRAK